MSDRVFAPIVLVLSFNLLAQSAFAQPAPRPADRSQYDQVVARARQLLLTKKPKEAVAESERAIRMDESRWEAYVTAASGYTGLELFDDAIGMLQMALPRAPEERKGMIRDALRETRQAANRQAGGAPMAPAPTARDVPAVRPATPPAAPAGTPTQAEIVLWKSIENSTNAADYEGYLTQYPNGVYAGVARTRLAGFNKQTARSEEETLWHSIENSNNEDDYRAYLRKFPNGTFAELARARMERAEWIQASNGGVEEIRQFIEAHPESEYTREARRRIAKYLAKQEQEKADKDEQQQVKAEQAKLREERKRAGTFKQAAFSDRVPGYLVFDGAGYRFEPFNGAGSGLAARKEEVDRVRVTGANEDNLEVRLKNGKSMSYRCALESELLSRSRGSGSCRMTWAYQSVMDIWTGN